MKSYPLLFTFRDLIVGQGFLAGVEMRGRALLVEEDEETWIYGVNPGGLAATNADKSGVMDSFKKSYQAILNEIAGSVDSFAEFEAEVNRFFDEDSDSEDWTRAVERVRSEGETAVDWVRTEDADGPTGVSVMDIPIEALEPSRNRDPHAEGLMLAA